jgi:hypothetical protein
MAFQKRRHVPLWNFPLRLVGILFLSRPCFRWRAPAIKLKDDGLLLKSPGANIKEFLVTILSEAKRPQT